MSGICGAWSFDGSRSELGPMLALLERRGPDGTHAWAHESVTLGHSSLATTPEALIEVLPLNDGNSRCTITADVRLDNREELIDQLELDAESRMIGDGELILRAYLKWGEDCVDHLLGDFAFAIWDPSKERLFCARDHMGMRQLIYHHAPGRLFAFATEADALVAHPSVPQRINQGRIADYLDELEGLDLTSTFFEEVVRLPPAHLLSVDSDGLSLRRYWTLQPGHELKLETDQAYADAFLSVFTEAVRCRLRSAGPVGSMLSGGLDSNSVAAVAAALLAETGRGPLPTFSAFGSDVEDCAESQAIRVAIRSPSFSPTLIRPHQLTRRAGEVLRMAQQCAEPFDAYMTIPKATYQAARRQGIKIVFDGAGGDVTLTAGNQVADHLSQGKLYDAAREARLEAQFWGPTGLARRFFLSSSWAVFAPFWLKRLRRRLSWWVEDCNMRLGRGAVSREFAKAVNLGERRKFFRGHLWQGRPTGAAYRAHSIGHPHLVVGRERYDRVASAFGVEPRDPFMDIRLIAFALSLPAAQLQSDGWPKFILRRAVADMVPSEIAWRRGKPHLGWLFTTELIDQWMSAPREQASAERVDGLIGGNQRSKIALAMDKASWFKITILANWLNRNQNSEN